MAPIVDQRKRCARGTIARMALNYPRWRTEDLHALLVTFERRLANCLSAGQPTVFYAGAVPAIDLRDELQALRAEIARRERPCSRPSAATAGAGGE